MNKKITKAAKTATTTTAKQAEKTTKAVTDKVARAKKTKQAKAKKPVEGKQPTAKVTAAEQHKCVGAEIVGRLATALKLAGTTLHLIRIDETMPRFARDLANATYELMHAIVKTEADKMAKEGK